MERRRSKLHRHYYDPKRVGSYGGVAALRRVVPAERDVERWLSTQDAYTLHKTGEGATSNAAASWWAVLTNSGRPISSRHVASESSQRRDDIPADRDRCVFETGVVHSAEEQVGGVAGGRLQTVAKRRQQQQTDYVANR